MIAQIFCCTVRVLKRLIGIIRTASMPFLELKSLWKGLGSEAVFLQDCIDISSNLVLVNSHNSVN
jgi:hypothetical protein